MWLPAELRDLVEVAGLPAALALVDVRPGERIFVPKAIPDNHWIAVAVGVPAAARIANRLGGSHLTFPTSAQRGARAARRACDAALAQGASVNEAVRVSGLSYRTVQWRKANKVFPAPDRDRLGPTSDGGANGK